MTEIVTSNYERHSTTMSPFLEYIGEFGFELPRELHDERTQLFASLPSASHRLLDAISDHLDRCGHFYTVSADIQNSERRLEIHQGLLLYAAGLWCEADNYGLCVTTLQTLKEDIVRSRDTKHLTFIADLTEKMTEEYAAAVSAKHIYSE